jgi:nitrogen fixation-related uncharacterized protein
LNIDIFIYAMGAALMMIIYAGFLIWGIKTEQFKDNEHLRYKPLEDEEEKEECLQK